MNQLKDTYRDRWQTFLGNTRVMQFFGSRDLFTAEHVSKLLGQTTVMSISTHEERGESGTEAGRSLMTTDEVLNLDQGDELLFVQGLRPIRAKKLPYYLSNQKDFADPNPMAEDDVSAPQA